MQLFSKVVGLGQLESFDPETRNDEKRPILKWKERPPYN
jgi:hypothetical protein